MTWQYWLQLYLRTHCVARGLRPLTIAAYEAALGQFRDWLLAQHPQLHPGAVSARQVLEYLEHLRRDRHNGDAAVNRAMVILRSFYRAIVAMGHLEPAHNPLSGFPKIKAVPRKLPICLSAEQMHSLVNKPASDTILGLRDRALLALLYASGIRASECATLTEQHVDLKECTVRVRGKGGHDRVIPLNDPVVAALRLYREARGPALPTAPFFRSRFGRALSRGAVFERVRSWGDRAHLGKPISPHRLRHTFATHLIRAGVNLVTVRDLLGHRQITSTQIYLHVSASDLRAAADKHPIAKLLDAVPQLLPHSRLPLQHVAGLRRYGP
jgi:site-specific recombinase XerD